MTLSNGSLGFADPVAPGTVSFRDENLESLRALILLKSQLGSPELAALVGRMDNAELSDFFERIIDDASRERSELEAALREWARSSQQRADARLEVTARDVVTQWIALLESSARRARVTAHVAPTPEIRSRLESIAAADEARARALSDYL